MVVALVWSQGVLAFVDLAEVTLILGFVGLGAVATVPAAAPSSWRADSFPVAVAALGASVWPQFVFLFVDEAPLVDWNLLGLAEAVSLAPSGRSTGSLTCAFVAPPAFVRTQDVLSLIDFTMVVDSWASMGTHAPSINKTSSLTLALVIGLTMFFSMDVLGLINEALLLPVVEGVILIQVHHVHVGFG